MSEQRTTPSEFPNTSSVDRSIVTVTTGYDNVPRISITTYLCGGTLGVGIEGPIAQLLFDQMWDLGVRRTEQSK